ncbi:MAG: hypothetical protein JW904_03295 [Spirochaetales bacterium]|nr:hypothetical protein [Spirochaetales bacterium]
MTTLFQNYTILLSTHERAAFSCIRKTNRMKKKKLISKSLIILSFLAAGMYLAFFPNRIIPELVVMVRPAVHVPETTGEKNPAGTQVGSGLTSATPFFLNTGKDGIFGYIDAQNAIIFQAKSDYGLTMSPQGFISYPAVPGDLVKRDVYGHDPLSISGPGYPLFAADGERLFIITSDCTSLREVNRQGVTLWRRSVPSWITSFAANADLALLGLSNGQFLLFGKTGDTLSGGRINDSRVLCIYGTAIQEQGKYFAILTGADPLFLVLYDTENFQEVFRSEIDDPGRTERRMMFSPDSKYLFFEQQDSLYCLDLETHDLSAVHLPGTLLELYYQQDQQLMHLVCRNGESKELLVVYPPQTVIFRTGFASEVRYLGSDKTLMYTGRNRDIVPYGVEEQ